VYEKRQTITTIIPEKEYAYTYDPQGKISKITQSRIETQEFGLANLARQAVVSSSSAFNAGWGGYASQAVDGLYGTEAV